jgi:DNA repair photolyase
VIHEVTAKSLLMAVRGNDRVFGLRYNFNIYRGCPHQCIYCDSRSECYGIEDFRDVIVKINAAKLLAKELPRKRIKGPIGTGSMSDPYNPVERKYGLTRRALEIIAAHGFPVHIITKSDLVTRDADLLEQIEQAAVCFTLTGVDDALAARVEPGAPPPSARLAAMRTLAERGIAVGVALMPVLPFIGDSPENITAILQQSAAQGGTFVIPWFGMSMRDRQREWYYGELDRHFPGLRAKYEARYGNRYDCAAPNAHRLGQVFCAECARLGLSNHFPEYKPLALQPALF